jgi:hypothetical protein
MKKAFGPNAFNSVHASLEASRNSKQTGCQAGMYQRQVQLFQPPECHAGASFDEGKHQNLESDDHTIQWHQVYHAHKASA